MTHLQLCRDSLDGLSVGDALGAQFFVPGTSVSELVAGRPPASPWPWTDDTEMACSVFAELRDFGKIDQDRLASAFAHRYEPYRGYGAGSVVLLRQVRDGAAWQQAAAAAFDGKGSMGNGAAMRVAPIGAFHAGDTRTAALEAMRSAEVTHAHPEAVLGAIAVAVAAAEVGRARLSGAGLEPAQLLDAVLDVVATGQTGAGIARARSLLGASVAEASYELGNGARPLAQTTVPFTLWAAATYLHDYPRAIIACIEAGGDVDTTAAIVGGIVATFTGIGDHGVPRAWLTAREPLPAFGTG
ncbi:ADP-ribosylglycohydrolase family protein [Kineosporia babensis]|uniref:ADP-ribosylglycohydrolase family protein n=1 Tax=Kineosporia babensis TaxID=499548 RepID=A0A9X1NDR5_9ACTN|nr:ADP-ribosylglycohydrolase family protein [Kineosporia babensis]MCD5311910.1 ADP-ribosylglycohydrolase family protein [Kineosporia babensis]